MVQPGVGNACGRFRLAGALGPAGGQYPVDGMKDKLVDGLRLAKPYLDLGRVHVDVDLGRRQLQKQHVARLAL